jgi:flagellar hook protein FlgE
MISAISSSISALNAFGKKLGVIANNIANVNTEAFKKSRAIFKEGPHGGVQVSINGIDTPGHPIMDEGNGEMTNRETSNVDLTEEIPRLMLTKRGYQANLKTIKTQDEMLGSLIDILR